jgi:ABC-2 type transport system ATP-binding protein
MDGVPAAGGRSASGGGQAVGVERHVALAAHGIVKRYGRRTVLDGAGLTVRRGQAVAIVGENGAGKTTLLRICARLLAADAGTIAQHGRVGYCPQEPALFDLLTAREHIELFAAAAGIPAAKGLATGQDLLAALGYRADLGTPVRELSGGTRQKLNLAMALLAHPDVLLLDEPYQGFDHGTYADFWTMVSTWRDHGAAVVVVTHMLTELWRVDHVVDLSKTPLPA